MGKMLTHFISNATIAIAPILTKGIKDISDMFLNHFAKVIPWDEGHILAQPVIEIDGDNAKGHWIMFVFMKEPMGWRQCRYDCEYARENGEWKFSSMKLSAPWPIIPANNE
jgi:hypothetical protein